MEGRKLNDYTWIYPIDGHQLWLQRFIYLNDIRNTYCPNCECRFEFPEGIESIKFGACPDCKTVFFFYPSTGFWYYLPDDFEFDVDICPDCKKDECPEQPEMADFYYCLDCNIEFCWQLNSLENGLICFKYPYKDGKRIVNKQQMNDKYKKPDPFGVLTNKADGVRKGKIIEALNDWVTEKRDGVPFKRALDIGCGEGFITKDIPADEIVGFDISDVALSRCPEGIIRVDDPTGIKGKFDLIVVAGTLVREYDFVQILHMVDAHASDVVLTCQTDVTEVHEVNNLKGTQVHMDSFPYNSYKQVLRVFSYADVEPVAPADEKPIPDGATVKIKVPMKVTEDGIEIDRPETDGEKATVTDITPEVEPYDPNVGVEKKLDSEGDDEGKKFPDAPESDGVSGTVEETDPDGKTSDSVNF